MPRRRVRTTVRTRILIIMTWIYLLIFIVMVLWFYNVSTQFVVAKLPADQAVGALESLRADMTRRAIPLFIGSYSILLFLIYIGASYIMRPIRILGRYAENISKGDYTRIEIPKRITEDEIDVFAEVFQNMVDQVRQREEALKRQVVEMQIIIDEAKKQKQVEAIVESEMFVTLKEKAQQMRDRKSKPRMARPDVSGKAE